MSDMSKELSPSLQEVQDRFIDNYTQGGIPAVERMIDDLAAEAEAARTLADSAEAVEGEAILAQDELADETIIDTVAMADSVHGDSRSATSRHSLALFLLNVVRESTDTGD